MLFILPVFAVGQLSRGGIPVQIQKLKSASPDQDMVVMPALDNQKLRAIYCKTNADQLKPFRFAHPFDVSLTPGEFRKVVCRC